jgi:N-sulfoglucosamine sulfohydrolase
MVYLLKIITCAGLLTGILLYSCSKHENEKGDRPNILLIVSEDNSQDLGCYGNSIVHTPNLDRLAENGVRFTNAYVTTSVCSPCRSSIFTGFYVHQNGQFGWATHNYTLFDGIKVLPQYLKEVGYRTGILGKIHVNPEERFNFDFKAIPGSNFQKRNMSEYATQAKNFVRKNNSDKPYFLMVNFPDAHLPFQNDVEGLPTVKVDTGTIKNTLPFVGINTARLRTETEKYYNCMNRLDESIGMLLDSIGDLSDTFIFYLSDHGAQFSRGKLTNYEGGLKIPFIIQWGEGIKSVNLVREELVSVIDILPTILDLAEREIPEELPGKSILSLFEKDYEPSSWRQYLGSGGAGESPVFYYPRRSIRGERYKLIHNIDVGRNIFPAYAAYVNPDFASGANEDEIEKADTQIQAAYDVFKSPPEWELYDLKNDPWEFENLAKNPDYKDILKKMQDALMKWQQETNDPFLDEKKLEKFTNEMDSINQLYPNHSYQKIEDFKFSYHHYLTK